MFKFLIHLTLSLIKWGFILTLTITLIILVVKLGFYLFSTYPFTCTIILLLAAGTMYGNKKNLIIQYFHQKQVGSIEDIQIHTKLEKDIISELLIELLKENKVELLLSSPEIYKWTENREYPEGMISREITL